MSLFISSINSGSNGNCYYIGNGEEAILIDAGISCRETERRMKRLGLDIKKVKAIFISHEHSDHIRGLDGITKKHNLPVYITEKTKKNGHLRMVSNEFVPNEKISVGAFTITAFPKFHDAIDPHSFIVESNEIKIGVMTDIGVVCDYVRNYFAQCHAVFLEANYDDHMLMNGKYPYFLKKRISSDEGHLSNAQALELFLKHKPSHLSHLILSHLSRDNNSPELVHDLFSAEAGNVKVHVASRYNESPVFRVTGNIIEDGNAETATQGEQLSLFGEN